MTAAFETPGGSLVRHLGRSWLKAQRSSKDYVNHYLVAASAEPALSLVYIDPDTELEPVSPKALPQSLTPRDGADAAQPGDLLLLEDGRHLVKALDVKKDGQRHLAYVELATGEVRPRQERGSPRIFSGWELIAGA